MAYLLPNSCCSVEVAAANVQPEHAMPTGRSVKAGCVRQQKQGQSAAELGAERLQDQAMRLIWQVY